MKKYLLISIISLIFIVSCVDFKKVQKAVIDNPKWLTELCPKMDTILIPKIDSIVIRDTVYIEPDTLGQYAFIERMKYLSEYNFKQALDSIILWNKKHPKIVKTKSQIIKKIPYPVADKILILDARNKGINEGFKKGFEAANINKPVSFYLSWFFGCLSLFLFIISFILYKIKKSNFFD